MTKHVTAAALGVVLLTLAGCATTQEPASICNMSAIAAQRQLVAAPAHTPGQESPLLEMPLNSVNITDVAIINKVYVRTVNARRTPTGTVEVWSQIVNCTDYPLMAEARTQFFDGTQYPSEPVSAWKRIALDPRTSNTYREMSIGSGDKVSYYMVELREGR
jgi:hypothetical protein